VSHSATLLPQAPCQSVSQSWTGPIVKYLWNCWKQNKTNKNNPPEHTRIFNSSIKTGVDQDQRTSVRRLVNSMTISYGERWFRVWWGQSVLYEKSREITCSSMEPSTQLFIVRRDLGCTISWQNFTSMEMVNIIYLKSNWGTRHSSLIKYSMHKALGWIPQKQFNSIFLFLLIPTEAHGYTVLWGQITWFQVPDQWAWVCHVKVLHL
jgi:hypothetical protein